MDAALGWSFFISWGVSACCGWRAGLSLLGVSLVAHLGWLWLHPAFDFMTDWRFISLVVLAALVESIIDKFRTSSVILDSCGLVVRTGVALWLVSSLITNLSWGWGIVLGIALGGATTFLVNLAKPLTRTWLTDLLPGATALGSLILSCVEDLAICLALLGVFFVPWLGLVYALAGVLWALFVLYQFIRQGGNLWRWHWDRIWLGDN